MELFALTSSAPRIRKLILRREAQDELRENILPQIESFMGFEESFELDAGYTPAPHEVFEIKGFEDIDNVIDAVRDPAGVSSWTPELEDLPDIKGFFFGEDNGGIYQVGFQLFDRRQVISQKFTLWHSSNSFDRMKHLAFSLDTKVTAVLSERISDEGKVLDLFFRSLYNARRIFDMDMYFKEATEDDVNGFFNTELFEGYDKRKTGEDSDVVDDWCRKKISFILKEGKIKDLSAALIKSKAEDLGVSLTFASDDEGGVKLVFPEGRSELKRLLRFLDEDIYKSSLTDTIFVAGNKRKG